MHYHAIGFNEIKEIVHGRRLTHHGHRLMTIGHQSGSGDLIKSSIKKIFTVFFLELSKIE